MLCSRCLLLLLLVVYFLMDELCAFLIPDRLREKRQSGSRSEQDLTPHFYELSDLAELFPGNEGEMTRDWDPNPARSPAIFTPLEQVNTQPTNNNRRRTKDSRRRITVPLDRIGSSHLSSRSRKEEPEDIKSYEA